MAWLQPLPPSRHGLWSPTHRPPPRVPDSALGDLGRASYPTFTWAPPAWLCLTLSLLPGQRLPGQHLHSYFWAAAGPLSRGLSYPDAAPPSVCCQQPGDLSFICTMTAVYKTVLMLCPQAPSLTLKAEGAGGKPSQAHMIPVFFPAPTSRLGNARQCPQRVWNFKKWCEGQPLPWISRQGMAGSPGRLRTLGPHPGFLGRFGLGSKPLWPQPVPLEQQVGCALGKKPSPWPQAQPLLLALS